MVVEVPSFLDGAGSGGWDEESPSASGGRCEAGRGVAACVGTGWSEAAGTEVWVRAVGTGPGWPEMWTCPVPAGAGGGTGSPVEAAGGSWGWCAGPVTLPGRDAAAAAAADGTSFGAESVEAGLERLKVGVQFGWVEGLGVLAADH